MVDTLDRPDIGHQVAGRAAGLRHGAQRVPPESGQVMQAAQARPGDRD